MTTPNEPTTIREYIAAMIKDASSVNATGPFNAGVKFGRLTQLDDIEHWLNAQPKPMTSQQLCDALSAQPPQLDANEPKRDETRTANRQCSICGTTWCDEIWSECPSCVLKSTKFELTEEEKTKMDNLLAWQEMSAKSTIRLGDAHEPKAVGEKTELLKQLLATTVELLPRHSRDCGVHGAHPNYGDQYCTCRMQELRDASRAMLAEREKGKI